VQVSAPDGAVWRKRRVACAAVVALGALSGCLFPGESPPPPAPATIPDLFERYALAVSSRSFEAYEALHVPGSAFQRPPPCNFGGGDFPWVPEGEGPACLPWLDAGYWETRSVEPTCWAGPITLEIDLLEEAASDSGRDVTVALRVAYFDGRFELWSGGTHVRFDLVEGPEGWRIRGARDLAQDCR
jgi:hypothetical protein